MKLGDWLKEQRPAVTQDAFGMRIGVTQGRVSQIIRGGTSDSRIALRIQDATGGMVTVADLLPEQEGAAA